MLGHHGARATGRRRGGPTDGVHVHPYRSEPLQRRAHDLYGGFGVPARLVLPAGLGAVGRVLSGA